MPGNFKGMKKTGKWLRHCCASFPSRRSIVVRGATSTAANLGARVSRVKRAFAMTKALKSGQLALTRAECQYFSLHPLNGKISFPSFGKPRSEEHTSELQSLMPISYAVFCLKKKNNL